MKLTIYRFIAWLLDLLRVSGHNWHRRAGAVQAARTRKANREQAQQDALRAEFDKPGVTTS